MRACVCMCICVCAVKQVVVFINSTILCVTGELRHMTNVVGHVTFMK